ncbi:hypothetical protein PPL_03181 [Heterostelium album PN500]|uniref:B box-type domain-containing protein n=1 Tax=Heterostelium pallidum (strain ATCC 26659 / Pp 5 / PN500) TaxID=670386 RepID=D3B460_HETP5|nr:hypothetical protein PPL_03181 [Heterostelium album PN500]EFA84108.1 hypothetical protein PPL_03181 [Heterostelium album PN500]|eukprot:XP_020436225.1 hypothetical protein PPL_03181 [Heterostelium album PN500]
MSGCSYHNRILELICFDCNMFMCSECPPQHKGHSFANIDNIKSNNNNKSIPSYLDLQSTIKSTFDSLESSVKEYEQLQQTEDEISNRFRELHEFLVVEERRLKKSIINNKELAEQQIEYKTNVMKSLSSINHHLANIETFWISRLGRPNIAITDHNLVYHQPNDDEGYIYSIQKKYIYSIEDNKCEPIFHNDKSERAHNQSMLCVDILFQR